MKIGPIDQKDSRWFAIQKPGNWFGGAHGVARCCHAEGTQSLDVLPAFGDENDVIGRGGGQLDEALQYSSDTSKVIRPAALATGPAPAKSFRSVLDCME